MKDEVFLFEILYVVQRAWLCHLKNSGLNPGFVSYRLSSEPLFPHK